MTRREQYEGLQLQEDINFQRRYWRVQRVGWAISALVLMAAIAGLFGGGLLSRVSAGPRAQGFWVEYERFDRAEDPSELRLHLPADAARDGLVRVWFNRAFVDTLKMERMDPAPEKTEISAERVTYWFRAAPGGELVVNIRHQPENTGRQRAWIGVGESPPLQFTQFIYP